MKLRTKILLIFGLSSLSLLIIIFILTEKIMIKETKRIERNITQEITAHALKDFHESLQKLEILSIDWAYWDDAYNFVQNGNKDFIISNMTDTTFSDNQINLLVFFNAQGRLVKGKGFDLNQKKEVPILESFFDHLDRHPQLTHFTNPDSFFSGIICLEEGPMLIASRPILTSNRQGPIRGTLIFGSYLDELNLTAQSRLKDFSITLYPFNRPTDIPHLTKFPTDSEKFIFDPVNNEFANGYTFVKDIYGQPGLLMKVTVPREIWKKSRMCLLYFSLLIFLGGLVLETVAWFLLNRLILRRVNHLSQNLHRIGETGKFSERVEAKGNDELSVLASSANKMLASLERYHSEDLQTQKLTAIGQLAAGIAHEINTPMQYVGDNTRFLKDSFEEINPLLDKLGKLLETEKDEKSDHDFRTQIEESIKSTDVDFLTKEIPTAIRETLEGISRVSEIVRAMKAFSHPNEREKEDTDINEAILDTLTVTRNEWKYVADLETALDPDLPLVPCLRGEFNQVILNLIVNAAQAIEDANKNRKNQKGKISLLTRKEENWVEIRIRDTGTGIPKDVQPRIFDPFFTTKEVGKGTGQGLAISRSVIMEKHHGTITFETEEGKGTTFIIRLPLTPEAILHEPGIPGR